MHNKALATIVVDDRFELRILEPILGLLALQDPCFRSRFLDSWTLRLTSTNLVQ